MRLLSSALLACLLVSEPPARAADSPECSAAVLALLGRELKVAHFLPGPPGVVVASSCRRATDDARMTLAAAAWDAGQEDSRPLAVAIVDEGAAVVVSTVRDEIAVDAATAVTGGSLRIDTAPYDVAPGVRAFGVDVTREDRNCGGDIEGPVRTLYVRRGLELRPILQGLSVGGARFVRGNVPRCVSDPKEAETAILEDFTVRIALGEPGPGGWRDLLLTATSSRSDHRAARKPLHARLRYDGTGYPLDAFDRALVPWRQ